MRGDDRRGGREHDEGYARPVGGHPEEGVGRRSRFAHQQRRLAEVVEQEAREHQHQPCAANGRRPEVAQVGVERLGAGDREDHRAQGDERARRVRRGEGDRVARRQRREDTRSGDDARQAENRERSEPEDHHRSEDRAEPRGTPGLQPEKRQQDHQGHLGRVPADRRRAHLQALDRRQHGDRRGDHAVAVEQRSADHAQEHDDAAARRGGQAALGQRGERDDAALTVVVCAQHERHVLHRDHGEQRPDDQGRDPQCRLLGQGDGAVIDREHRLNRVQGARADVTEHDPHSAQDQSRAGRCGVVRTSPGGRHDLRGLHDHDDRWQSRQDRS